MSLKQQLAILFATLSTNAVFAQNDWKLQPLPYNNPTLQVDLGVGLWAWPMPMDYDEDGDFDLLVGCPDKPSNGVYFFENPTQDPKNKLPVFRPAVRIGKAVQNLQVSYVNQQPRILATNVEFLRQTNGVFDFDKPSTIYPKANIHNHAVRANMWRYVDFDGDGDQDLSVGVGDWSDYGWDHAYDSQGRWQNGPLHGYVYIIENVGTAQLADYKTDPFLVSAGGQTLDVYGWPSPNFADFDADGDLDLLCGEFLDGFTYFENIGSRTKPEYASGIKLNDSSDYPLVMHVQMITPTAFDWDQDGDFDLIVGDEDGRVALVENSGALNAGVPVFHAPVYFQQQADTLKFGALATPMVVDWDKDGDQDIVSGNTAGNIAWFENLGINSDNKLPIWNKPQYIEVRSGVASDSNESSVFRVMAGPAGSIQGPCEAKWGYTTLCVADWEDDGDHDIIFNSILGEIELLRNVDGHYERTAIDLLPFESGPAWNWTRSQSNGSVTQWRTTPFVLDFDQDQQLDLISLDQEGFLTLRRKFGVSERIFVDLEGNPLRLNSKSAGGSGRVKLCVADWNGDSKLDLLVSSQNASLYINRGIENGKVTLDNVGNLTDRDVSGHTNSPTVCDFDADGKLDLLIGSEDGRMYHIKHEDCLDVVKSARPTKEKGNMEASKFPGYVSSEYVYDKSTFPECHASTICETSRGLVAAWFGGTKEGNKDVGIWVSYHDGVAWSAPQEVATGQQHESLRHPCWNPVLFQAPGDGPLYLFFKVGPSPSTWWGEAMVSYDRGRTFRDRRRLPEGIDGPVRCKPILLSDNKTLLCGSSTENDGWRVHFEKVTLEEQGVPLSNWRRIGPINSAEEYNAIQPTFLTHPDGRIQVLCRSKENVVTTSFSSDMGETWSKMEATDLPNPNSGIEAVTLADGRHLLVYNHLASGKSGWGKRGRLDVAISKNGISWTQLGSLEQEENQEFSYPAVIQARDGLVHITYTWKRKRIKHVVLDPSEFEVQN